MPVWEQQRCRNTFCITIPLVLEDAIAAHQTNPQGIRAGRINS